MLYENYCRFNILVDTSSYYLAHAFIKIFIQGPIILVENKFDSGQIGPPPTGDPFVHHKFKKKIILCSIEY